MYSVKEHGTKKNHDSFHLKRASENMKYVIDLSHM